MDAPGLSAAEPRVTPTPTGPILSMDELCWIASEVATFLRDTSTPPSNPLASADATQGK